MTQEFRTSLVKNEIKKSVKHRRNIKKQSLKKPKENLQFILIVLELLQQLRSFLQSIANALSTEQLETPGKINLKMEPVPPCLRKLGDLTFWTVT